MAHFRPGSIVRTLRDGFHGQLEQVMAHRPYMNELENTEEEPGIVLNEPVEETTDSDFVDPESQYESDFENEPINEQPPMHESMTSIDIGCGIQIITTQSLAEQLKNYKAVNWSPDLRNSLFNVSNLESENKFVTNIFKLSGKPKLANITNPNENKLLKKKRCVLSLREKYKDQVYFRTPLDKEVIQKDEALSSVFSAWIQCGEEWKSVSATYKDGFVKFLCCRLNSFVIVCRPASIEHIISPAGTKIFTSEGRVIAEFEPGTVDFEQKINYSIKRPNHNNINRLIEANKVVIGVSDRICITQCEMFKFKKPMTLLSGTLENGSDFDSTVELVGFVDNKPVSLAAQVVSQEENQREYKTTTYICDGAAFVQIRNNGQDNATIIESLKDEIDVAYGDKYLCKMFLFFKKKVGNLLHLTAECCLTDHSDKIKNEYLQKQNRLIYESDELCLPTHQRLRIHPTGSIKHVLGSRSHIFLFFMYLVHDNRVDFTVEINKGLGQSVDATLEFSADNQRKGEVATAQFSPDNLFVKTRRPLLKRTKTTMNDNYRSKPSTPSTPGRRLQRSKTIL